MRTLAGYLPWKKGSGIDWGAVVPAVGAAAGYYAATHLGFAFKLDPYPISVLWPANSLLLASLLLIAPRHWWLVIAAVLPAHLLAQLQSNVPLAMVMAWYVSNCSEALIGAALVRAAIPWPQPLRFDSFRSASVTLVLAGVAAPFISSFIDAGFVRLIGWGEVGYLELVQVRFFSNMVAAITLVPLVLTLAALRLDELRVAPTARHVEVAVVLGGLALTTFALFDTAWFDPSHIPAFYYLPLPFFLWAAVRLGPPGSAVAIAVLTLIAIRGAVNGYGPFADEPPAQIAHLLQIFIVSVAVPLLLFSVALKERERTARESWEQREQLTHLSRVAMLGDMSGGLAHELNQPLTAILSNAQAAQHLLANKTVDDAELGEILSDIIAADRRAGEVIQRLRALFRRGETHFERLDPNELVRDVLKLVHGELVTRAIDTVLELGEGLPEVQVDRVQLQQVMLNLVMNARDAMANSARAERVLNVSTRASAGGVDFSFSDRGAGFPAGMADKLFEAFYTTKPQGLGLGLPISRSIVVAHGGRLWGTPNGRQPGATFHILLPATRPL